MVVNGNGANLVGLKVAGVSGEETHDVASRHFLLLASTDVNSGNVRYFVVFRGVMVENAALFHKVGQWLVRRSDKVSVASGINACCAAIAMD